MTRYYILMAVLISLSSCYFMGPTPLRRLREAQKEQPYDVAIVPGLPFKNGQWDTLIKIRIMWSVYLYKHGLVKNVIYSGAAVYTPYVEGKAMALYALALGMDSNHIFIDTLAEHSTENLYFGYKQARQLGFEKVALSTDPVQCFVLHKFAKRNFGHPITLLPIVYDSIRSLMIPDPVVNTAACYKPDFISLEQRQTAKQRIKGWKGKKLEALE